MHAEFARRVKSLEEAKAYIVAWVRAGEPDVAGFGCSIRGMARVLSCVVEDKGPAKCSCRLGTGCYLDTEFGSEILTAVWDS